MRLRSSALPKRFLAVFVALALACAGGCEQSGGVAPDLEDARLAMQDMDWNSAERRFVRYLRDEEDTEARWQAWQGLMALMGRTGQVNARVSLEYLETMRAEYDGDDARLRVILPRLAACAQELRRHDQALGAWDEYTQLSDLTEEETANGHLQLARLYTQISRYAAAASALQDALAVSSTDAGRAVFLYELAELYGLQERWQEAMELGMQVLDSSDDAALCGRAYFLLGDACEQLKKPEQARHYYTLSRAGYPNPLVVDKRLALLHKKYPRSGRAR